MNTIETRKRPDPKWWDDPQVRAAIAARDITRLYRLLQKFGCSQQRIAAWTGQSQPEVSAIIHGRKVMSYDVLERIIVGLGIPRELAGLGVTVPEEVPSPPRPTRACNCTCHDPRQDPEAPDLDPLATGRQAVRCAR